MKFVIAVLLLTVAAAFVQAQNGLPGFNVGVGGNVPPASVGIGLPNLNLGGFLPSLPNFNVGANAPPINVGMGLPNLDIGGILQSPQNVIAAITRIFSSLSDRISAALNQILSVARSILSTITSMGGMVGMGGMGGGTVVQTPGVGTGGIAVLPSSGISVGGGAVLPASGLAVAGGSAVPSLSVAVPVAVPAVGV